MHWRTIAILATLVALLAGVAWWRSRGSGALAPDGAGEALLCEGLDAARVVQVALDHVERAYQAKLERQADGSWSLVEPIATPADGAWVAKLVQTAREARGVPLPDEDPAALGLSPPRAVVVLTEEHGEGTRTWRLELGARDVDVELVHVRALSPLAAAPVVARVARTLDTTLDRNLDDLRSRRILPFALQRAQALERRGDLAPLDAPLTAPGSAESLAGDLALEAERAADGWRSRAPRRAALDWTGMFLLCGRLGNLDASGFRADAAPIEPLGAADPALLAPHGLDRPLMTFRLEDEGGEERELHLGVVPRGVVPRAGAELAGPLPVEAQYEPPERRIFTCRVLGRPVVYEITWDALAGLAIPFEALLDYRLARAVREDVRRVELTGAGRTTVLEREERGPGWTVSDGAGPARAAERGAVEDLLGRIERSEILLYVEGQEFHAGIAPETIAIVKADGARLGGELGIPFEHRGVEGRMFRRFGDETVGLVPASIGEWVRRTSADFESLVAVAEDELDLARIELGRGAQRVAWVLQREGEAEGQWWMDGARAEDREFALLVDALLNVKVREWLEPGALALEEPVEVRLVRRIEGEVEYALGRPLTDGTAPCRIGGRIGNVKAGTWEALGRLLDLR